jgi:threonine synthase
MQYYSTNNRNHRVTLKEAVLRGLAPDDGLYMPEYIPVLPKSFFDSITEKSFQDNSLRVAKNLVGDDIPDVDLKRMIENTIQFDAPLVDLGDRIFSLELFHGPTMAFKDFGARFMSQLLSYFSRKEEKEIVILVATSGDTGSAVANGFLGVEGIRVVVLYPSGKVSDIQEKQFTTLGKNITALEVDGTFDDCQRLVKSAFQDEELRSRYFLTSANSINIARLIPQSFYYFHAWSQLTDKTSPLVFAVPSGNFGNLTGGVLAQRMGLPINHFVIATNENDIIPEYLKTKVFTPKPSVSTISNAMDVGNPSNFHRLLDLYDQRFEKISAAFTGYRISDEETRNTIRDVFINKGYLLDPHGAVGYAAIKKHRSEHDCNHVFLETAHPAKFKNVVEAAIGQPIAVPDGLLKFLGEKKSTTKVGKEYLSFKKVLGNLL